ncbi:MULTISPECIES: MmpS family transport accessory protein [Gordonia]|uniref:MmpS family membrane protein n=2 Tax=Gordonia TaxID=2053 RepID=L7LFJ7_9ACTN|nr:MULTISPECIES: MmpS family transport accessory protein [Gordonia]AUH69800.1 hypothetical protein CXX93_17705 [Gordonia sp. YC-JH1]KJR05050.1 hypothetical protein UG54_17660 [Gordonia sihwensis]KXT56467.1 hypothetical protein Y710_13370 [Gordonia sp. QH-12]MBY4571539.1 hypothetical protein [Gordonia sihwensis]WFN93606.1 MmpS family transport accessory protein [Gordonia sihwensis]
MTNPESQPQQPNPYGQQPNPYGQPYPYAPQPPAKKRKKWPWIVGGLVVLFIAVIAGCSAMVGGVANEIDKAANSTATVTYRVTGGGTASVTYSDKDFNMAQDTAAQLPWTKDVTLQGFGKIASLTATNDFEADASQTITCEILVNGQVKNTQTSKGPAATANCTYSVPTEESQPSS